MTRRERDELARDQKEQTRKDEQVRAMTSHLLPLSAVPETLPVLFGPDGSAPDAPMWRPPLWDGQRWAWDYMIDDLPRLRRLSLRLDVESVAARVAGLCARALQGRLAGSVVLECGIQTEIRLGFVWGSPLQSAFTMWTHDGRCTAGQGPHLPRAPLGQYDPPSFLAALFLSLAPRIAALRGSP